MAEDGDTLGGAASLITGSQESCVPHFLRLRFCEVQELYKVSDRLDSLAEQHSLDSEALIAFAGNVRNTATLSESLVAMKIARFSGLDPANA